MPGGGLDAEQLAKFDIGWPVEDDVKIHKPEGLAGIRFGPILLSVGTGAKPDLKQPNPTTRTRKTKTPEMCAAPNAISLGFYFFKEGYGW